MKFSWLKGAYLSQLRMVPNRQKLLLEHVCLHLFSGSISPSGDRSGLQFVPPNVWSGPAQVWFVDPCLSRRKMYWRHHRQYRQIYRSTFHHQAKSHVLSNTIPNTNYQFEHPLAQHELKCTLAWSKIKVRIAVKIDSPGESGLWSFLKEDGSGKRESRRWNCTVYLKPSWNGHVRMSCSLKDLSL